MDTKHYKPLRDIESERAVLSSLLIEPELIYQIDIKSTDFTHTDYKLIYEAMLQLYADGIDFEMKTISDIDKRIPLQSIMGLFNDNFTSANIHYHVNIVKQKTFDRKCREMLYTLNSKIGEDTFLIESEKLINSLHDEQNRTNSKTLQESLQQVQANIDEARKTSNYGIQTGFHRLNDAVVGMCKKHFWILGGYTSLGKSTVLSQIIADVCGKGYGMVVFSVEDSVEDKLVRLIATKTGIPIKYIVRGEVEQEKIAEARGIIEKYNLSIYDDIYTLEDMELKIKKHKIKNTVDVVAIDFVQNIMAKGDDIYNQMREVAIKLQKIAKKHNICMLGLSQISEGKDKGSISLRGAQELASSADIVLWIDRKPDVPAFDLIIRKNRPFGVTGKIPMTFSQTWTNIKEVN